jgi:hypothetical protein
MRESKTAVVHQKDQSDLLRRAMAEPQVAEAMEAYLRVAQYLPVALPGTVSRVVYSTGANS